MRDDPKVSLDRAWGFQVDHGDYSDATPEGEWHLLLPPCYGRLRSKTCVLQAGWPVITAILQPINFLFDQLLRTLRTNTAESALRQL